jgi:AcrR family transcriptional regulator
MSSDGRGGETRRRVIAATVALIERVGYRSVTVDAVARASGVSRSTIYRHWSSRNALVLDAFTSYVDESTEVADTGDAIADLRTYLLKLAFHLSVGGVGPIVTRLISDSLVDQEFAESFRAKVIEPRRRVFLQILLRGQQRGQIRRDVDLRSAVDALYGSLHHRLLMTGQPIDAPFASALTDFARLGLAVRPEVA